MSSCCCGNTRQRAARPRLWTPGEGPAPSQLLHTCKATPASASDHEHCLSTLKAMLQHACLKIGELRLAVSWRAIRPGQKVEQLERFLAHPAACNASCLSEKVEQHPSHNNKVLQHETPMLATLSFRETKVTVARLATHELKCVAKAADDPSTKGNEPVHAPVLEVRCDA